MKIKIFFSFLFFTLFINLVKGAGKLPLLTSITNQTEAGRQPSAIEQNTSATAPCTLAITISSTPYYCSSTSYEGSATVTPTGGTSPYTYTWSPGGQTIAAITGLSAGTYSVSVIDFAGCTASGSVVVTTGTVIATATPNSIIAGDSTLLSATCGISATFSWAPAAYVTSSNSQNTYAHPPVTTIFTVSASTGCGIISTTDTVTVNGCTFHDSIVKSNYFCASSRGSIMVYPYGGTSPYTYHWSPGGQSTAALTGLSAGSFDVTITDASGCNLTNAISVSSASVLYRVTANPISIYVGDSTLLNVTCNAPATFSWSPSLKITDPNSASTYAHPDITTEYKVTITTPCGTFIDSTVVYVSCFGFSMTSTSSYCSSGTATISPSGGALPYTYLWSPGGGTTATISGLSAGTYSVTAYDALGCSVSSSVAVPAKTVTYSISGNPLYIVSGDSSLLVASCSAPATYSWSPPLTLRHSSSDSTYALPTVTTQYTVTITTACAIYIDSVRVSINCFNIATGSKPAYCISDDGSSWATPLGGSPPYTYQWIPGGQTTDTAKNLSSGSYFIVVHDNLGCSSTEPVTITQNIGPPPMTSSATPPIINSGDSSYLTANCNGSATYIWVPTTGLTDPTSQNTYAHPAITTVYTVNALTICGTSITYDTVIVLITTGDPPIEPLSMNCTIFPNPGTGLFNLNYSIPETGNVQLTLINELGQIIYSEQKNANIGTNSELLNLSNMASGIYLMRLQTNGSIIVRKLVIIKN